MDRLSAAVRVMATVAVWCWWLAGNAGASAVEEPPAASFFFRQADVERAALSPSGRWVAVTARAGGSRVALVLYDPLSGQPVSVVAHHDAADVTEFHWVGDDRLVYPLGASSRNPNVWPGLFSVSRDGKERRTLVARGTGDLFYTMPRGETPLHPKHLVLQADVGGTDLILGEVLHSASGEPEALIPKHVDAVTGRVRPVAPGAPPNAWHWVFGPGGEPRAVLTRRKARAALHWRAPGQDAWKVLHESDWFEQPFRLEAADGDGGLFVRETDGSGFGVLKRFDFARGRPEERPLVSTPGFDFEGGIVSEARGGQALGVRVHVDAEVTHWFDPRLRALQAEADRRLPGRCPR